VQFRGYISQNRIYRRKKMKKMVVIVALIAAVAISGADLKLAYINSERMRQDYDAFADAQAQFDKDVAAWEAEAAAFEQELVDLQTELEQQALLLSDDKKQERIRLIEQKQKEYQQFLGNIFGSGGTAERRNAELTTPLLENINEVLIELARREGYDLILDVAGGNVAYIDENLDITDLLLEELNSMLAK